MRLNVGCGPIRHEGEIGVDLFPGPATDVQGDVCALPFDDNVADFVRLDHVLEHLEMRKATTALLEAYRVLRSGGTIRVGVPDFAASCMAYSEAADLGTKVMMQRWFYGSQSHPGEYHKSGWDKETLLDLMNACGYQFIVVRDDPDRTEGICIVAEAVKR